MNESTKQRLIRFGWIAAFVVVWQIIAISTYNQNMEHNPAHAESMSNGFLAFGEVMGLLATIFLAVIMFAAFVGIRWAWTGSLEKSTSKRRR